MLEKFVGIDTCTKPVAERFSRWHVHQSSYHMYKLEGQIWPDQAAKLTEDCKCCGRRHKQRNVVYSARGKHCSTCGWRNYCASKCKSAVTHVVKGLEDEPIFLNENALINILQVNAAQSNALFVTTRVKDKKKEITSWLWCYGECSTQRSDSR